MRDRIEPVFAQSIQHVRLILLPPSPAPLPSREREKTDRLDFLRSQKSHGFCVQEMRSIHQYRSALSRKMGLKRMKNAYSSSGLL